MPIVVKHVYAFVALFVLGACGAGKAVRPEDPTAANALGDNTPGGGGGGGNLSCTKAPPRGEPLVVDWKTNDQVDLTVALKSGIAVVAYDCKSIKLLKGCSAKGKYAFTSVSSLLQETVKIEDADEAHASLPFSGGNLGASMNRGSSIDIALAYVGKRAALDDSVARGDLTGSECDQATHFVRGATVGAFVMQSGTKGQAVAAAQMFGVGAGGDSSSTKQKLNSAGDIAACKSLKDGSSDPPEGCGAVVRLELVALGETVDHKEKALVNTCPDGFAPSEGRCVKKAGSTAGYRCQPDDRDECKQQCDKGNAESCYNSVRFVENGFDQALLLRKACDGNVGAACRDAAFVYALSNDARLHDMAKATEFAKKGCDQFQPGACSFIANFGDGKNRDEKRAYAKKACDLGVYDDCMLTARLDINDDCNGSTCTKTEKHTKEGLDLLDTWCSAGKSNACQELTFLYGTGHMHGRANMNETTEVAPDQTKANDYQAKYCKLSPKDCGTTPTAAGSAVAAGAPAAQGFAGTYTSGGKVVTFNQVANQVTFTSKLGDTKCDVRDGTKLSCNFKDAKTGKSGMGMLFRGKDGKLTGQYLITWDGKKNIDAPKEVNWAFTPKKK